jgi:predicted RNase H-like HicB family nuclease
MLITTYLERTKTGYRADVPDLPHCAAAGDSLDQALAKIHLAIEVSLGEWFAREGKLPTVRPLRELQESGAYTGGSLFEIYVEDLQLAAMAVHQSRR